MITLYYNDHKYSMNVRNSQIPCLEFEEKLNSWNYILIDLRTTEELMQYWIIQEKQIHIDVYKPDAINLIEKLDTTKKYLLYCWHWIRSAQVRTFMQQKDFIEVHDLQWWIDEWNRFKKI